MGMLRTEVTHNKVTFVAGGGPPGGWGERAEDAEGRRLTQAGAYVPSAEGPRLSSWPTCWFRFMSIL